MPEAPEAGVLQLTVQQLSQGAGKRCPHAGRAASGRRGTCPTAHHLSHRDTGTCKAHPEQQLRLSSVGAVS